MVSKTSIRVGLVIEFNLQDLEGVTTPYNDALVIYATVTNYV